MLVRIADNFLIADSDSKEYFEFVEWYNAGNEPTNETETVNVISVQNFKDRFTLEELAKLVTLAKSDIQAELFLLEAQVSENVVLDNVKVLQGMAYLVSKGVISNERAKLILS